MGNELGEGKGTFLSVVCLFYNVKICIFISISYWHLNFCKIWHQRDIEGILAQNEVLKWIYRIVFYGSKGSFLTSHGWFNDSSKLWWPWKRYLPFVLKVMTVSAPFPGDIWPSRWFLINQCQLGKLDLLNGHLICLKTVVKMVWNSCLVMSWPYQPMIEIVIPMIVSKRISVILFR